MFQDTRSIYKYQIYTPSMKNPKMKCRKQNHLEYPQRHKILRNEFKKNVQDLYTNKTLLKVKTVQVNEKICSEVEKLNFLKKLFIF